MTDHLTPIEPASAVQELCDRLGTGIPAADYTICLELLTFREFGLTPPQESLLPSERDRRLGVNGQPFVRKGDV